MSTFDEDPGPALHFSVTANMNITRMPNGMKTEILLLG